MTWRRILASALLAIAAAGRAAAQQAEPSTFRAGVDLVRLDVTIADKDGRPVRDLKAHEIEITDEGRRRPVVLLQRVEEPDAPYADAARRAIAGDVSTNQGAPRGQLYVLVFDTHHITPGNEQGARAAAQRFLRTRVRPGDRVALHVLPGPGPQIEFTADAARVSAQLASVSGSLDRVTRSAIGEMRLYDAYQVARHNNDAVLMRMVEQIRSEYPRGDDYEIVKRTVQETSRVVIAQADEEARRFLLLFATLVRSLTGIEGRKDVILFSEGFYIDNVRRELEEVAAAAAQAHAVVYSMDLNRREVDPRDNVMRGGEQHTETHDRVAPLASLAAETAGELIHDATAQLDRALNRIASATQGYYIVGFTPGAAADPQRYRRITMRVTRPDVRVSTRTGYAAAAAQTAADRRRSINLALRAPFAQQGLAVEYTTYVLRGGAPGVQRVALSLAASLPVGTSSSSKPADVVFVVRRTSDGRTVASGTDTIALPETAPSGSTTGIGNYTVQFELTPGDYVMRAVVREPGGLVGSADRRFTVRALDGPDLAVGDLIVGVREPGTLPVRAVAYTNEGLAGLIELYGRRQAQLEDVDVRVDLVPLGGDTAVTSGYADLAHVHVQTTAEGAARGARIELPLRGVPPGPYIVRAMVRANGETVTERVREVEIQAGAGDAVAARAEAPPPLADARKVIAGDVARRYVAALRDRNGSTALVRAADVALGGDWAQAETMLKSGAGVADAHGCGLLGLARLARAAYAEAAAALRACASADRHDAATAFFLGWALAGAGEDRGAVTAWRAAAFLDPTLVAAHLALADTYLRLSQPALAIQALQAGLAALPDAPELRDRLLRLQLR